MAKGKKTPKDKAILWYIVKELLVRDPSMKDEHVAYHVLTNKGAELQTWLLAEARFVYSQKVKRGELPPPEGYTTIEHVQDLFSRLSTADRNKFVSWVQFTTTNLSA